jgi:hypothetical protein
MAPTPEKAGQEAVAVLVVMAVMPLSIILIFLSLKKF